MTEQPLNSPLIQDVPANRIPRPLQVILALLITAIVLPQLLSDEQVRSLITSRLTPIFGSAITTLGPSIQLLPLPRMYAKLIQVKTQGNLLVQAESVTLPLNPGYWLFNDRVTSIYAQKAIFDPQTLFTMLSNYTAQEEYKLPSINIDEAYFEEFDNGHGPQLLLDSLPGEKWQINLKYGQQQLKVKLSRLGKAILIDLETPNWHFRAGDKDLLLTNITAHGRIMANKLEFSKFSMRVGAGNVRGTMQLSWLSVDRKWNVSGSLNLNNIDISKLLVWAEIPIFTGAAEGILYVSGRAEDFTALADSIALTGMLTITKGKALGFDLIGPTIKPVLGDTTGGETPFDGISLNIERTNAANWLFKLEPLRNGLIMGSGLIQISDGLLLNGMMNMRNEETISSSIPLLLSGTISSGIVRLAPEALASLPPYTESGSKSKANGKNKLPSSDNNANTAKEPEPW
ncbi:hypothetical protein TI04_07800 [Achromatium sp. WMS2]|nr:hypothetical protein TI04_07800 [Achromatium sp. WMS2]